MRIIDQLKSKEYSLDKDFKNLIGLLIFQDRLGGFKESFKEEVASNIGEYSDLIKKWGSVFGESHDGLGLLIKFFGNIGFDLMPQFGFQLLADKFKIVQNRNRFLSQRQNLKRFSELIFKFWEEYKEEIEGNQLNEVINIVDTLAEAGDALAIELQQKLDK